MKVKLVGSSVGSSQIRQHLTTLIVNDCIAVDAGSLGILSPVEAQREVRHVLISHSHIDHLATLPSFLDNVFQPGKTPPTIYASRVVWESLNDHVFNDRLWPNLERVASEESSFYTPMTIDPEVSISIDRLVVTPVSVNHAVPTLGFLIEDDRDSIIVASDTTTTSRIWELANQDRFRHKLRAVFLECSFPNTLEWLAKKTYHLCPKLFANELAKIKSGPSFETIAVHLKPGIHDIVANELNQLGIHGLQIGVDVQKWNFNNS